MCGPGWPYYAFLAAASGQLGWQIWTVDLSSRADCNRKYVLGGLSCKVHYKKKKKNLLHKSMIYFSKSLSFINLFYWRSVGASECFDF